MAQRLTSRPLVFPAKSTGTANNVRATAVTESSEVPSSSVAASCCCHADPAEAPPPINEHDPPTGAVASISAEANVSPLTAAKWENCRCGGGPQPPDDQSLYCALCTLVVSKSQLLEGIEEDDDDIEQKEIFPLEHEEPQFNILDIIDIDKEGGVFQAEHLEILRQAFDTDQIFHQDLGTEPIRVEPFQLNVDEKRWASEARNRAPPRPQSLERRAFIEKTVAMLLEKGCIEKCQARAYSQVHITPKKEKGEFRLCIDFRGLNDATQRISWPILGEGPALAAPNMRDLTARLGAAKHKFFAVMDLTSGYWQNEIHPDSQEKTAFIKPGGLSDGIKPSYKGSIKPGGIKPGGCFKWKRVPMGLQGAGSYFQAMMTEVIGSELLYNGREVYLDDVIVHGKTHREYLDNLIKLIKRFALYGVRLSPKKCRFGPQK
jgi:hypothetical protein